MLLNETIAKGGLTTVIRVRGYNETNLDGDIEVAVFGALMPPPNVPHWQGNDEWIAGYPWWVEQD